MLRLFEVNEQKPCDATYKASSAMMTGSLVVKDTATKTVDFASAPTAENVIFVTKAAVPEGANAYKSDFSDYEEAFNTIKENELVILHVPTAADVFGTDQFDPSLVKGDPVAAGTDGKAVKATGKSRLRFIDTYDDNGHTLARIEYLNDAA